MQAGVKEVWARGAWAAIDVTRAAGLPVQAVFVGLPFDERMLRTRARVSWDHYVMIIERMNELCGGPAQLESLVENTIHKVLPEVRSLAGAAVTPFRLMKFFWEILQPFVFPMVTWRAEDLGDDRLRLVTRLDPGYRECEVLFTTLRGAIRSMTRHLDLPPIEILSEDIGPTHSVYEVQLPEPPSFTQRALRIPSAMRKLAVRIALGAASDGAPLTIQLDEHDRNPYEPRVLLATRGWCLSPREAELLRLVVEGHSERSIASTLGLTLESVEKRIAELTTRAGVASKTQLILQFWTLQPER
ncbi:MAG: helix-turn-helix transcriptional regulator [Kofleriaceae bacterium]|nr:helix-turn-helix transcriptional regulator [Kofleriaceae bacterium]